MPHRLLEIVLSAFMAVALASCAGPVTGRDVTRDKAYQVGYSPGQVYRLKTDQEIVEHQSDDRKSSYIYARTSGGLYTEEKAGMCFLASPGQFERGRIGAVPAGTRLQIVRLKYHTFVTLSDVDRFVIAFGQLLDPPFEGREVALTSVSKYADIPSVKIRAEAQVPDSELIEQVPE